MKRFTVFAACSLALLAGCSRSPQQQQQALPSQEVLQKAAQASLALESARYELAGTFDTSDANDVKTKGTVNLRGVLQERGEQIQFDADISASTAHPEGDSVFAGNVSVVVAGSRDLYVRLNSFSAEGPNPVFNDRLVQQFSGKWWRVPTREDQAASVTLTPDPSLLHAQAQVVTVSRDRGLMELRGRSTYHYDVAVDPEKLVEYLGQVAAQREEPFDEQGVRQSIAELDATGELWIDAETYYVQRLQWNIKQVVSSTGQAVGAAFSADFFDHDAAPAVDLPEGAVEFTPFMFLDAPTVLNEALPDIPESAEDDIIRQLLEEGASNPYANP